MKVSIGISRTWPKARSRRAVLSSTSIFTPGGTVAFGEDVDALVEPLKPGLAFTLGA